MVVDSRILHIVVLSLGFGMAFSPMANAQDVSPGTVVLGAWQGTVEGNDVELAVWYQLESRFTGGATTPHRSHAQYAGYVRSDTSGCSMYLSGKIGGYRGEEQSVIESESRAIVLGNRNASSEDFKRCPGLNGFALVVIPGETDTVEYRQLDVGAPRTTLERIAASGELAVRAAAGRPEVVTGYTAESVPTSIELELIEQGPAATAETLAEISRTLVAADPEPVAPPVRAAEAPRDPHKPLKVDGFYLVDRHGVDKIHWGGGIVDNGDASREFGTTNVFLPGDRTREVAWRESDQTLLMYGSIKYYRTGETHVFRKNAVSAQFQYDSARSKAAGVSVWHAREQEGPATMHCIRWQNDVTDNTCLERRSAATGGARDFYMTPDLDVAKALFMELTPTARMISRDDNPSNLPPCDNQPVCGVKGGDYINAIVRGDIDTFKRLDLEYSLLRNTFESYGPNMKILFGPLMSDENLSALGALTAAYMHDYQYNPESCFEPGAQTFDFKAITDKLIEVDGFGNRTGWEYGGHTLRGHFRLNPEFFALCDELCGVRTLGNAIMEEYSSVINAVQYFRRNYDCRSPAVQSFEKNLIAFNKVGAALFDFPVERNSW